jgi:hypothetical protein
MKNSLIVALAMFLLASCSDEAKFKTVVNEDGSFEKTITVTSSDSSMKKHQYLGVSDSLVWNYKLVKKATKDTSSLSSTLKKVEEISSIPLKKESADSSIVHERVTYDHQFSKKFSSTDAFNKEQQQQKNNLPISASFNKRFRWFYTYFDYAETYGPINFLPTPAEDFINAQDFDFIAKLPAEGKPLSKADSVFLENLNVKISDQYGSVAYFNHVSEMVLQNLKEEEARLIWKENEKQIFEKLTSKESSYDTDVLPLLDSLNIRKYLDEDNFDKANKAFEEKLAYLMWASDSHFTIEIEMPGTISTHNADSVTNRVAMWKPSSLKFLLKPYTFQVSARKVNEWAWVVSAVFIGAVVYVSVRYSKKRNT